MRRTDLRGKTAMLHNLCLWVVVILASIHTASACSPVDRDPTTEQLFAKATTVFVAHIVHTEESQIVFLGNTESVIEATFRTIEVLKGRPPEDGKVRSLVYGPGNCTIPILAGWDFVFFLRQDASIDDHHNLVWWPTGSFGTFNLEGTEPKRILQELRNLANPTK